MWRKRTDPGYEDFVKSVKNRDNKTCQMCGSKKSIQVHHIQKYADAPFLRTDPLNGICLCKTCHKNIKNREEDYISYFITIALNNENSI